MTTTTKLQRINNKDGSVVSTIHLFYHLWRRFLAYARLDENVICEESVGLDEYHDYHDYTDSVEHEEDDLGVVHFYLYTCKRCGKRFCV